MFFDEDDVDRLFVRRTGFHLTQYLQLPTPAVPTYTEDGIPIRKLYVSNLPPKTSRSELFGVFTQYGIIKSCWLRMAEKGPNKSDLPTYAFVTFNNPVDAHKALVAPKHEKSLRGRTLKISPADSWHQPSEDADGNVHWKKRGQLNPEASASTESNTGADEALSEENSAEGAEVRESQKDGANQYTILDILNTDCLNHILSYVPVRDLIRSERVSKRWHCMIQEYIQGIRIFKTSCWKHNSSILTTAVLRKVLQRLGSSLLKLHIDHHWSALNDRTAHTVGKFCPNLEEIKIVSMTTKNWNPLIYGCKQLKNLMFISCNKVTDTSLIPFVKNDTIETLTIANNSHVTGLFLTGSSPPNLYELSFYNCYNLQGTVLSAAIDNLPNITVLRLDAGPISIWKLVPTILKKLPKLQTLSLSEYSSVETSLLSPNVDGLAEAFLTLPELKNLDLARNLYVTNDVVKNIAQACPKIVKLNISSCNAMFNMSVGDDGLSLLCRSCTSLQDIDISYLSDVTDAGIAALAKCQNLRFITARGCPGLTAEGFIKCLQCPYLEEVDVCGCDCVSEDLVTAANEALGREPRALTLWLAGTAAATDMDTSTDEEVERTYHKLLTVDINEDRCNPQLRSDYEVSDNSNNDYDPYILYSSEDDFILDEEDLEFELEWGLHAGDILLM